MRGLDWLLAERASRAGTAMGGAELAVGSSSQGMIFDGEGDDELEFNEGEVGGDWEASAWRFTTRPWAGMPVFDVNLYGQV